MYVRQRRLGADEHTVSLSVRPATIKRGSQGTAYINVLGYGTKLRVLVSSSHPEVIVTDIAPECGRPPFTTSITIHVSSSARPGTYYLHTTIVDVRRGSHVGSAVIPVFVVNSEELTEVLKDLDRYRGIYEKYGIQYTILKILEKHRLVLTFSDIKVLYEAIVGHRVSNGSVGYLLSRLQRKGLVLKVNGYYMFNPKLDLETARTIIDIKRALNGLKGARASTSKHHRRDTDIDNESALPRSIERALSIASKLIKEDYWKAVDFIAHTLVGVRKSGTWLLWVGDYFIYREEKTGFLHYLRSEKLSELLKSIGLREGFMMYHIEHSAEDLIHRLYRSYANARRLHYQLKELDWFNYGEPIILEIYHNADSPYLALRKLYTDEVLLQLGDPSYRDRARKYLVYGGEHIDQENETTYFYRPSNLF